MLFAAHPHTRFLLTVLVVIVLSALFVPHIINGLLSHPTAVSDTHSVEKFKWGE